MEGCSKRSAGAVSGLPDDPLVEILSRVPAKSVCRFKCVSKAWRDLIADPHHRKKLRQPMQGLFVQTSEESEVDDDELVRMSFNFINLTVRSVPLDIDPCISFLTEMTGFDAFLLDSCNGLILFGHGQMPWHPLSYTVCNPTTKQWSAVPACGSGEPVTHTYLAFDPAASSHFHLLQFQITHPFRSKKKKKITHPFKEIVSLHVYSSETGTWGQNQIDEQKEQGQLEGWHHGTLNPICAFVNGFLHVIVSTSDLEHILVIDVQGKARRLITVPGMADGRHGRSYVFYLGQSQGHLHCVTLESADDEIKKISIWILQDHSTQEWVLKNTVDLNSLNVFGETGGFFEFQVVDIHQDCNMIFFLQLSRSYNCKLIAYDMDHKEVSVIATFRGPKDPCDFARYVPYFSESPALTNKH